MAWFSYTKKEARLRAELSKVCDKNSGRKFSAAYIAGCPGCPEAFDLSLFDQRSQHGLHSRGADIGEQCAQLLFRKRRGTVDDCGLYAGRFGEPFAAERRETLV